MKKIFKSKILWYRRIRGVDNYTPVWYLFGFPYDVLHILVIVFNSKLSYEQTKERIARYWNVKKRVNTVRKQCRALRLCETHHTTNTIVGFRINPTTKKEIVKIYYKFTSNAILFKFKFYNTTVQKRDYEKFVESCNVLTGLNVTPYEINSKNGYAYFKLFENPVASYEFVADLENHAISIGTGFEGLVMWYFDKFPHLLLVGETGTGKSTMMAYLLSSLLQFENIYMLDGKVVDYSLEQNYFAKYLANEDASDNLIFVNDFYKMIKERYALMKKHGVKNYNEIGLKPCFLIMDEFIDIVDLFGNSKSGKALKDEMASYVGGCARLGRAAGMFIITILQRPDASFIDGNTRDQFQLRIVLGSASDIAYKMAFEQNDLAKLCVGKAWYKMGPTLDVIAIPNFEKIVIPVCESEGV